ncbi:MAG: hypothetical protein LBI05_03335 [Planctomycetaceae bacterium]|jgi:hypothetical protein|nr:hypothetical protein [Planctomycetaceae bacterium]
MQRRFRRPVNAVRFRQWIQRTLNYAAWGLFLAAIVVLVSPILAGAILFASVLLGLIRSHSFLRATRMIDQHYHLHDRILTAIDLLRRKDRTLMEQLQIDDTAEHIPDIQPQDVYPIRLPKMVLLAAAVLAVDLTILYGNLFPTAKSTEPVIQLMEVEDPAQLDEIVAQTEELIQTHPDEAALKNLVKKLDTLWDKFDLKTMNIKESLATISEMEDAFQSARESLQLETMEESIQELAKTLELADQTAPIGKSLEKGDFHEAAMEMKKMDAETMESLTQAERKAMAEQMQTIADNAEQRNQNSLHDAAQDMSDALENNDGEQYKSAADALANEVEKHGVRQDIGKDLAKQQMALGMLKAESGSGPGNMSGGEGVEKTDQASQTWGMGAAGNPNEGKETDLQGERQRETLTGALTEEGDSLTETIESRETAEATSLVQYREQYKQYQKISEAVLDAEPIPLGQRQVIRRYFESIRPEVE